MNYFLITIVFFVSFILTYLVRILALKKNIIDTPNERSSHTVPTPRGGGLAIAVTWYTLIIFLYITGRMEFRLAAALFSGILLSIVSLIDDIISLSPKIRILSQIGSAGAGLLFLGGLHQFDLGLYNIEVHIIAQIVPFLGVIWMINLFNFLDGTDGYLGSEGLFVFLSFFILAHDVTALYFAIIILGFLFWNWPKAKIFCGDVGSTLIGYTLAILTIYYQNTSQLSLLIPVILSALFWFDASVTLFRRWRNKEKLSVAHKKHAYQRLNQSGFSHLKVLISGWMVNIILFVLSFYGYKHHEYLIPLFIVLIFMLSLIMFMVDKRKKFE
jgi:UDP-N-acetylmuramyl pentapeptide phosphotransferase/UDP-N-acetylglucosamine-1-phosphate transferase